MTDIDLIKQALEYLEDNQHHIADHERHAYVMLYNDCITALKARLAQETALQILHTENERLGLYKDAYGQPEQEPVACERCKQLEEHAYDLVGKLRVSNIKLSMRPQRTWAGLTDEDCEEVERWVEFKEEGSGRIPMGRLAAYISEKLRSKNT
jgi:hypothetical protein